MSDGDGGRCRHVVNVMGRLPMGVVRDLFGAVHRHLDAATPRLHLSADDIDPDPDFDSSPCSSCDPSYRVSENDHDGHRATDGSLTRVYVPPFPAS